MGHNWTLHIKSHSVITHLLFRCLILVRTHKKTTTIYYHSLLKVLETATQLLKTVAT